MAEETTKPAKKPKMTREAIVECIANGQRVGAAGRFLSSSTPKSELDEIFGQAKEIDAVVSHDENGFLTRAGMEFQIACGGSCLIDGENYKTVDDLPDEAVIAKKRERAHKSASTAIDDQIAKLHDQKSKLEAPAATPHAKHAPAHK